MGEERRTDILVETAGCGIVEVEVCGCEGRKSGQREKGSRFHFEEGWSCRSKS